MLLQRFGGFAAEAIAVGGDKTDKLRNSSLRRHAMLCTNYCRKPWILHSTAIINRQKEDIEVADHLEFDYLLINLEHYTFGTNQNE